MLSFLFQLRTVTAQVAGNFSQQELKQFWIRVLFANLSDNTLQLLGKAISYEIMNKDSSEVIYDNPYDFSGIGLHGYTLNPTLFFTPE